jgi:hypothetical protein
VCGLALLVTRPLSLAKIPAVQTRLSNVLVFPSLPRRRRTALLTIAKTVPLLKGVLGLDNFATSPYLLAQTLAVQTILLSVVDARVMSNVVPVVDATREHVLPALETEIVITTLTVLAA